jgi:N-dimethylarginine dimethylaminohydrolase
MSTNWQNTSAYQGRGWKPRLESLRQEIASKSGIWSPFSVNSEWSELQVVALYRPRSELNAIKRPQAVQHLRPLTIPRLYREYRGLLNLYRQLSIQVIELDPSLLPKTLRLAPPNLMFVRDLFFNTMEGCIVGRMASRVRAGEEKFAAASLASQGIPIRATVGGRGLFEGADALWLDQRTVLCGVGNRTNRQGYGQFKAILQSQGVRCLPVALPNGVQHLLGILQIVDGDLAVARPEKASKSLLGQLRQRKIHVISVGESDEVLTRQGMNFVTIRPRTIVMAKHCPELRTVYEQNGITVAAEVEISQLCNAAGGLACATGIVARRVVP